MLSKLRVLLSKLTSQPKLTVILIFKEKKGKLFQKLDLSSANAFTHLLKLKIG